MAYQLVDPYGNPVRRAELLRPQAEPGITGVRNAWAGTVASGLTPQKLAGILRACDEGDIHDYIVLAEEMEERDPHYASVLGVRKRAVSGIVPTIKAASDDAADVKLADAVREHIAEQDGFADLVEDLLDALGKGFSVVEIDWKKTASHWTPQAFDWRTQRHFMFDRDTGQELRLIDEQDVVDGLALEPFKFIQHRAKLKSGMPARGGLARLVAFSWMCKAYTIKDWMAFAETYGLPLRLGRYDGRATKEDVEKLFLAVANIGTDAAAVLPKSMEIEFQENSQNSGDKVFEPFARYLDEQVSKGVLGQTMTSDNGSSQAQANVHNEVRHDIAVSDARSLSGALNRDLVRPYIDLNFGVQIKYPVLKIEIVEPEDLDMILKNVDRMAKHGVKFKQTEIRTKLGFADPDDDDEIIGGPKPAKKKKTKTALNRQLDAAPNDLDEIEAEMLADWEEVSSEVLAPVEDMIAGATDYADAMNKLTELSPNLPSSKLIDALVKGAFKARSIGDLKDG